MWNDPSEVVEVPPFERLKQSITAQMRYRCAWDNNKYTIDEFSDYYGKAAGESLWKLAPHFNSIKEFCKCFALKIVSSPEIRLLTLAETFAGSSALFGLWVPGCLLLADVHHLASGKLKGSRLAPHVWRSDIWDNAWQIGHAGTGMMVLDWTQLMDGEDPLANLGRVEMAKELDDFCELLDGRRTPPEYWIVSELERMTGWPCAVSGLHMPCQAMFFACHAILIFRPYFPCFFHVSPLGNAPPAHTPIMSISSVSCRVRILHISMSMPCCNHLGLRKSQLVRFLAVDINRFPH